MILVDFRWRICIVGVGELLGESVCVGTIVRKCPKCQKVSNSKCFYQQKKIVRKCLWRYMEGIEKGPKMSTWTKSKQLSKQVILWEKENLFCFA